MSHSCAAWVIAIAAAVPFTVNADAPAAGYCRRGEVSHLSTGKNEPLVVYDDQGEIVDANAKLPDPSEFVSARVVDCREIKGGISLYKVQLNASHAIWVRARFVNFKPTEPTICETSTQYPTTNTTAHNVDCTK